MSISTTCSIAGKPYGIIPDEQIGEMERLGNRNNYPTLTEDSLVQFCLEKLKNNETIRFLIGSNYGQPYISGQPLSPSHSYPNAIQKIQQAAKEQNMKLSRLEERGGDNCLSAILLTRLEK